MVKCPECGSNDVLLTQQIGYDELLKCWCGKCYSKFTIAKKKVSNWKDLILTPDRMDKVNWKRFFPDKYPDS